MESLEWGKPRRNQAKGCEDSHYHITTMLGAKGPTSYAVDFSECVQDRKLGTMHVGYSIQRDIATYDEAQAIAQKHYNLCQLAQTLAKANISLMGCDDGGC